jgi:hypothetical protein
MLTLINLFVIDKIFNEVSEVKLSALSKMLYINCLTYHFKDKLPKVSSAVAFEILNKEIPSYNKYEKYFIELHKAELIVLSDSKILFNNVWGNYIDRSKLEKVSPDEYVAGFSFQSVLSFKDELFNNEKLFELTMMKNKLSRNQIEKLLNLFIKEQETFETKYNNFSECAKHFSYWILKNINNAPKESIKSSGKILGA